jgi:riboflavin kinase/FMN adenylyltransferase
VKVLRGDPSSWGRTDSAVAIGVFDGLHRGHQSVIQALDAIAPPASRVVLTFSVHPATVLSPAGAPLALTTVSRRLEILAEMGVDATAVLEFDDELRHMGPADFVERYLVRGLGAHYVAVGEGFRFGYRAAGDAATLRSLGAEHEFTVVTVPIQDIDGRPIRSTAIRNAVREGDVGRARAMLGRPHEIEGVVVPGDGRGREIGVPTANIAGPQGVVVPARGVYAVRGFLDGEAIPGVANIGVRPTFDGGPEVVEVHLLDTEIDLYDRNLRVEFIARLRDERRFDSVADLVEQIHRDIAAARRVVGVGAPAEGRGTG